MSKGVPIKVYSKCWWRVHTPHIKPQFTIYSGYGPPHQPPCAENKTDTAIIIHMSLCVYFVWVMRWDTDQSDKHKNIYLKGVWMESEKEETMYLFGLVYSIKETENIFRINNQWLSGFEWVTLPLQECVQRNYFDVNYFLKADWCPMTNKRHKCGDLMGPIPWRSIFALETKIKYKLSSSSVWTEEDQTKSQINYYINWCARNQTANMYNIS